MTTLHTFCKEQNLPKTSVRRFLVSFGFDTSNGLSNEAQIAALKEFKPSVIAAMEAQATEEALIMPTVPMVPSSFISSSELAPTETLELMLPKGFDPSAMVRHFDGVMGQTVNSDQVLAIASIATTAAKKAMDEKVSQQAQALQKAESDKKKLEAMIQGTVVDLKVSALKSQMLAEQQNATTSDLQEMLAQLLAMGKPTGEPSQPSQP
jgi:hypothetical protein